MIEIIVPAYLERTVIASTIERLRRSLESHSGLHRITVVASDEQTARAAASADRVIESPRAGKAVAANLGVHHSDADVIVFTDANCEILPFEWPSLAISGLAEWDLVSANKSESEGPERGFWAFERAIKRKMSSSAGTVSVVGEFLAMRRTDYRDIPAGTICDDLWLATDFVDRGLRAGVLTGLSTVEPPATSTEQWERRVRIAEGLFLEQTTRLPKLMRSAPGRQFVAHKLYRLTIGCLGFWLAVIGLIFILPPWSLIVGAAVAYLVAVYSGRSPAPAWVVAIAAPVGMQAVPIAAIARVLTRRSTAAGLWKKVAR